MRLREGLLIALIASCIYLILALFSYSPADPGWSHTGQTHGAVHNLVGRSGAWVADLLLWFIGYFAFLFPFFIGFMAIQLLRKRHDPLQFRLPIWALRLTGLGISIICGAGLATLHFTEYAAEMPATAGGILGNLLIAETMPVLNTIGSTLLLLSLFLFGFTIVTDLSWFHFMDLLGKITLDFFGALAHIGRLTINQWQRYWEGRAKRQAASTPPARRKKTSQKRQDPLLLSAPEADLVYEASTQNMVGEDPAVEVPASSPPKISQPKQRRQVRYQGKSDGSLPEASLLNEPDKSTDRGFSPETLELLSRLLEDRLKDFGVIAEVVAVHPGPVITRFEIQPAPGVKVSKIANLAKDLARSLAVISVRVVEVIPGKSVVGIEIPNEDREVVHFSEVINSEAYADAKSPLSLALGHDIAGLPVVVDLAKMPHLLVAGTTGSGKSVGVNSMLLSLLFKASPEEVRLIMVDPKMLELSVYEGIPHLLAPVVTDMKEAANALRWCVAEMERRYKLMATMGVRNIAGFNRKIKEAKAKGEPLLDPFHENIEGEEPLTLETLPFIVIVIDEFADMMMIVGKKVEELIARLAQKARAAGIHMILATQRPSVDVITGLIKANIPTRISFQVSSKVDSRTILDQGGAEQLLGQGDMLYLPPGTAVPIRVHGAFVADDEVHQVVNDWQQRAEPDYLDDILTGAVDDGGAGSAFSAGLDSDSEQDQLYDEAVAFVTESRRASISAVQRKLKIGYNRAARIIESMETAGVVSPMSSNGAREVLVAAPPQP
ncbi:DNA translocase FtsK [Zooshikella harenae]|uniref:DNA translocase FtsK n=1 Tax=Zooshikella harenae TaxID=2827238 RepID=A0ABS5ZDU3_9GAMM|nr:DNA translocase FtsK [Zooshikella harenae]MBU2712241.1 DNA translocase FtsK 4TM domain-containing protein [Zooshikella harenae]